jgi:hypothetical protein
VLAKYGPIASWDWTAQSLSTESATDRGEKSGAKKSRSASGCRQQTAHRLDADHPAVNLWVVRRTMTGLVIVGLVAGAFGLGYIVGTHANDRPVPNLLGLGTEDGGQAAARRELATVGLRVGKVTWMACAPDERGLVVHQNPQSGFTVPEGATVNISIGGAGVGLFSNEHAPCLPGEQTPAGQPNSG